MEFDKSRILTVVTADQAKVGQKGWFGETLSSLEKRIEKEPPKVLERVWLSGDKRYIFMTTNDSWSLFYPAPEPSYIERQAQWVSQNNVKVGTKVRVTRAFTDDEDGSYCLAHDDLVGKIGIIWSIFHYNLSIGTNDGNFIAVPYFALEVVKETTYRPYNNEELNDLVGEVLINKQSGRRKVVTGKPRASEGVNLDGSYITAKDLLASFYRNGNEPCGVREGA